MNFNMRPRRLRLWLILISLGAIAAAIIFSPKADAQRLHFVRTVIFWTGAPCIDVEGPQIANKYQLTTNTICWPTHEGGYIAYQAEHEYIGANPIMGNATSISCQVYVDDMLVKSSIATKGDGTDVNCLGTLVEIEKGLFA